MDSICLGTLFEIAVSSLVKVVPDLGVTALYAVKEHTCISELYYYLKAQSSMSSIQDLGYLTFAYSKIRMF